jgi:hypothetical protein
MVGINVFLMLLSLCIRRIDIIKSAKEEIGRHKHNTSVIRRNLSKNRMKRIASNSAPIKAKELIDFLIHNGLIDVRRNASIVIKVRSWNRGI